MTYAEVEFGEIVTEVVLSWKLLLVAFPAAAILTV
jgi:hypothetical protein